MIYAWQGEHADGVPLKGQICINGFGGFFIPSVCLLFAATPFPIHGPKCNPSHRAT